VIHHLGLILSGVEGLTTRERTRLGAASPGFDFATDGRGAGRGQALMDRKKNRGDSDVTPTSRLTDYSITRTRRHPMAFSGSSAGGIGR